MSSKLKTNFLTMKHSDCLVAFETILTRLTNNPYFPEPWNSKVPSLEIIGEAVGRYKTGYHAAINGDRLYIALRNNIREEVAAMLEKIAAYLEVEAADNPAALLTTGFELKRERSNSHLKMELAPPLNFKVVNAQQNGVVIASAGRVPGAASYEAYITDRDPSTEANWTHLATFASASKMVISDLEAGKNYFFRVRAIGSDGPGPWAGPVNTIVT